MTVQLCRIKYSIPFILLWMLFSVVIILTIVDPLIPFSFNKIVDESQIDKSHEIVNSTWNTSRYIILPTTNPVETLQLNFENNQTFYFINQRLTNFTIQFSKDISNIIPWPQQPAYNGYCGSQQYIKQYDALKIYDIVLDSSYSKVSIFVANIKRNHRKSKLNRFLEITQKYQYVICCYNNGQTVISHKISKYDIYKQYVFIECDIPLKTRNDLKYLNHFNTNLSVTLIHPILFNNINNNITSRKNKSVQSLIQSFIMFEGLPICNSFDMFPVAWHPNYVSNSYEYKYNLTSCLLLNPLEMEYNFRHYRYKYYNQSIFMLQDWIEYNFYILGVEHFVIYQHFLPNLSEKDKLFQKTVLMNAINKYLKLNIISYIEWTDIYQTQWFFQFSAYNSCLKRFGHSKFSKYLMFMDVDEYIVPLIQYHNNVNMKTLLQIIVDKADINNNKFAYRFRNHFAFTCLKDRGCDTKMNTFDTVLERHQCITVNQLQGYKRTLAFKVIINAMKVDLIFTHYADLFVGESEFDEKYTHYKETKQFAITVHAKSNHNCKTHKIKWKLNETIHIENIIKIFKQKTNRSNKNYLLPLYATNGAYCLKKTQPNLH